MKLSALQDKIIAQVQNEYQLGYNHIRTERERKRDIMSKVLDPNLPEGQIRVNLLWKNIQLENALFLSDEIGVKLLSNNGVLDDEITENAEDVLKYDDVTMELRQQRETIVNHNALYGLAVTVIDAWDNDEKQPIGDVIDPLAVIIDPQNYSGNKMRFFGYERRVSRDWVENTEGFENVKEIGFSKSSELELNKRASDEANNLQTVLDDEGMVDLYDHYMIYDGKKWLTTWANERSLLIRAIEIEPLTEAERRKPTKTKFTVQLHRRKPKLGSAFGVSIADEVMMYQDNISILTNLNLIMARQLALGPDTFIDSRIGVNIEDLARKKPGGRIIPVTNQTGLPTQNGIFQQQALNPSQYIDNMIATLEARAEGTTAVGQQSFGTSQSGSQTKAEIQTLQQNQNQILIWISNNYMEGQKQYWEAHYRSYVLNMGKGGKTIALFAKGTSTSKTLTRSDFISDGKVSIYITSRSQDAIENDKEFNKLIAISEMYLSSTKSSYAKNDFIRLLGKKTNIRDFDEYRYIPPSPDEMRATNNLKLLNDNIEVNGPEDGEDYLTYWLIYKQAISTPAAQKAVYQYSQAYQLLQKPLEMQEGEQGSKQASAMAMNNLSQTANAVPSTAITAM